MKCWRTPINIVTHSLIFNFNMTWIKWHKKNFQTSQFCEYKITVQSSQNQAKLQQYSNILLIRFACLLNSLLEFVKHSSKNSNSHKNKQNIQITFLNSFTMIIQFKNPNTHNSTFHVILAVICFIYHIRDFWLQQ